MLFLPNNHKYPRYKWGAEPAETNGGSDGLPYEHICITVHNSRPQDDEQEASLFSFSKLLYPLLSPRRLVVASSSSSPSL